MKALLLVLMGFVALAFPAFAERQITYTDEDLEKYNKYSTYDEETISRSEAELKRWEREKENEERLSAEKKEAENRRLTKEGKAESKKKSLSQETTKGADKNMQTIKKRKT